MAFMLQRMPWEAEDIASTHEETTGQPQRVEGNQHNKDQNSSELYIFYNLKKPQTCMHILIIYGCAFF